jgi:hypothetical protein
MGHCASFLVHTYKAALRVLKLTLSGKRRVRFPYLRLVVTP